MMASQSFHRAVTMLTFIVAACGNSCASLQSDVASIESVIKSFDIKSYEASRFHADLSRLDLASSSAAMSIKLLSSWMDLPLGSFGDDWQENSLRQSLDHEKRQITTACERAQQAATELNREIANLVHRSELDVQSSMQVHSTIASMGSDMISKHQGLGIENILMASHGSKLVDLAVKGQARTRASKGRNLGDAIDMLYIPRLFAPSHDSIIERARRLKESHDQLAAAKDQQATSEINVKKVVADSVNSDIKPLETPARRVTQNINIPFDCPPQMLQALKQKQDCLQAYIAVIASQASYANESSAFLQSTARHLAKQLLPWSQESIWANAPKPSLNHDKLFQMFNVSGHDIVVIAFKGTETWSDILTDVRINIDSKIPGGVHSGFFKRSQIVPIQLVTSLLQSGKHVILTGHSLGGGAAAVLALRIFYEEVLGHEYYNNLKCITFGAPLFASARLGQLRHSKNFLHFVLNVDLVPRLLLFKKDVYDTIAQILMDVGVGSFFQQLTGVLPWRVAILAKLGQRALSLYSGMDYTPFGAYAFLWKGQVFLPDQDTVGEFMQRWLPSLSADSQVDTFSDSLRDQ